MAEYLPNGIGATTGDSLGLAKPLITSGSVYYVDSVTGNASYTGLDRKMPLATLGAAVTAASAHDIVVMLSTHAETFTSAVSINKTLTVIGEGSSSGQPTVKLTLNHATANLITIGSAGNYVEIRNVLFEAPSVAATGYQIDIDQGDGVLIKDCYFKMKDENDGAAIRIDTNSTFTTMEGCTFISTETSTVAGEKPVPAVLLDGPTGTSHVVLKNVIFDGGTVGFNDGSGNNWAFDGSASTITALHAEGISLLAGADMKLEASTTGYVNVQTSTGGARVII